MDVFSSTVQKASEQLSTRDLSSLFAEHESLFDQLSDETLLGILQGMNSRSLAKTCKASKRLRALCDEHDLATKLQEKGVAIPTKHCFLYLKWSLLLMQEIGNVYETIITNEDGDDFLILRYKRANRIVWNVVLKSEYEDWRDRNAELPLAAPAQPMPENMLYDSMNEMLKDVCSWGYQWNVENVKETNVDVRTLSSHIGWVNSLLQVVLNNGVVTYVSEVHETLIIGHPFNIVRTIHTDYRKFVSWYRKNKRTVNTQIRRLEERFILEKR